MCVLGQPGALRASGRSTPQLPPRPAVTLPEPQSQGCWGRTAGLSGCFSCRETKRRNREATRASLHWQRWETEIQCTRLPETESRACWGISTAVWSPAHQHRWLLISPLGPLPLNEDMLHPSQVLGGWQKTSEGKVVDHHLRGVRHTDGPMVGHSVTLPRDDLPSARSRCSSELCRDTPPSARQPGTRAVTVLSGCGETEAQRHSVTYAGSQPSGPSLTPTVSSSPPSTHLSHTEHGLQPGGRV